MEKGKSQESLTGNQDMHNDVGSLRFTWSLFDYCLVWGANSFEEMEPQRIFTVDGMMSRTPVMVIGSSMEVTSRILIIPCGNFSRTR